MFEGVASVEVSCVVETFSAFVEFWGEFTDDTVLVSLEVVSLLVWFTNSSAFVLLDWVVAGVLAWFVAVVASPVNGVSSVVAFVNADCVVSCCAGFCATLVSPLLVFDDVLVSLTFVSSVLGAALTLLESLLLLSLLALSDCVTLFSLASASLLLSSPKPINVPTSTEATPIDFFRIACFSFFFIFILFPLFKKSFYINCIPFKDIFNLH